MSENNFVKDKLTLMRADKQVGFGQFADSLDEMAKTGESFRKIQIPADGNWFKISFDAIEQNKDKLIISARRIKNGIHTNKYDPSAKSYTVEFEGTRAAYLIGYYEERHRRYGWPYLSWDIRSYTTISQFPDARIYVENFYAHNEIKKLILAMENLYGSCNIFNSYINDNLKRFRKGIQDGKTVAQIEKEWSRGLMESLGYHYVEGFDEGFPNGNWNDAAIHWAKLEQDLRGGAR